MRTLCYFRALALALAVAVSTVAAPVLAQSVPHWNVTLPADPGTGKQRVTLAGGTLTLDVAYSQSSFHFALPLKTIASITPPYLYKGKNWLIDLKLSKKAMTVNTIPTINRVDRSPEDEVSIQFLNQADAAAGRAYILAHMHD